MKKLLLLIAIIIPAAFLLLTPGFYEPQDLHHLADIYQMIRAIGSGQLPPRLGPDYIFGYGYPLFNFYYPLPFYLGALFFFFIGSLTLSFKLVFITIILVSIIGMYIFLKELFKKDWPAFVGSILFLYTPYRAVQIYVRGAMGEALALAILPFFAWSIVRLLKKPNTPNIAIMGLIGSLFILSHNYFWVFAAPWLVTLFFVIRYNPKFFKDFGHEISYLTGLLFGGLLALALSAYWWFPALLEQKLVSSTTPFPLIDHFPFIKQLIIPSWGYGASLWGPDDGLSFQIGIVNLIVIAILLLLLIFRFKEIKSKKLLPLALWIMAGFLLNVFIMNVRFYPVWKILPFYNFVQFPWRLLSFTTFFTSISAGLIVAILPDRKKYIAGFLVVFFSILLTFNYFKPSQNFFKKDNDYLARFFANRTISGQSEGLSKEYLLYSEDYLQLPDWMEEKPKGLPVSKISSKDARVFDVAEMNAVSWTAKVEAQDASKITFHSLYFLGWRAEVDGKEVNILTGKPNGQIEISVKRGEHNVKFFWQETNMRKFADLVSVGALLLVIALFVFGRKNEK